MGVEHFDDLRAKVGKATQFEEATFDNYTTFENFMFQHKGSYSINQGNGVEMQLTLPGGNYELEAIVRIYNNSEDRVVYDSSLTYFLEENVMEQYEAGELVSTIHGKPHVIHFRTMCKFTGVRVIKFHFGTNAQFGGLAFNPVIMARRIGALRYSID